jgi:hypothetical protein
MTNEELKDILNEMDIPEFRLDISKKANVRWLTRNLAVRNISHSGFKNTIKKLKELS